MKFLEDHPSLIFLAFLLISALMLSFRFGNKVAEKPALEKGYSNLLLGYLVIIAVPIVILLLSDFVGEIELSDLKVSDSYAITLQIYGVLFVIVSAYWIYGKKGAEFLSEHPGLLRLRLVFFRLDIIDPFYIKSIFVFIWSLILFSIGSCWIIE